MEIKTVSNRMYSLVVLYDLHTSYFKNVLEGISDQDAHNRLNTKANHVAWLTGSLVNERFELAKSLGKDIKQNTGELFKNYQGIKDGATYPTLAEYKKDWDIISPELRNILLQVSDEKLDSSFDMQGEVMRYFDLVSFITYREANCIGQIALWRRLLGYEPMKYQ